MQSGDLPAAMTDKVPGAVSSMVQIKSINVCVKRGDITEEKTDAIVNLTGLKFNLSTAGEYIFMDELLSCNRCSACLPCVGSLSKAVLEKGGKRVQKELNKEKGSLLRLTHSSDLSCKHIIHIVWPVDVKEIVEQMKRVLKRTNELRYESISIPVFRISPSM